MSGIMSMLLGAVSSAAAAVDEFFNRVTLLLPGNGTNGAQNNTFLDSSSNNFTITRNGNTTQGTFSPFSQTGWSNYFDGTGDTLALPNNAAFAMSNGAFTIEFWFYTDSITQTGYILQTDINSTALYVSFSSSTLRLTDAGTVYVSTPTLVANTWNHIAVVRSGTGSNQTVIYTNGVAGTAGTCAQSFTQSGPVIGGNGYLGYISNLRIVKGSAVYTSGFTPPTAPLTNITNTSLLTCQSNRFVDNSTANSGSGFAITVNGNTSVQAFSPFAPTAAYSAATVGGSGYFDGSGDYLSIASNAVFDLGSNNWCIEFFIYKLNSAVATLVTKRPNNATAAYPNIFANASNQIGVELGGTSFTTSSSISLNGWNHVAVVRNGSGSGNVKCYINGTADANTGTLSTAIASNTNALLWGGDTNGNQLTGYFSGVRLVNGSPVYTANFTPPTEPLTAITNTQLLLNFTNAGITDATAKNDLETVGNAQISTTQSKFGGSSMYFDGTGDWLLSPASPAYSFGTGDFTIEGWIYLNTTGSNFYIYCSSIVNFNSPHFTFLYDSSNGLRVYAHAGSYIVQQGSTSGWSTGTWYHVAFVRSSGTVNLYRNGTSVASASGWSSVSLGNSTSTQVVGGSVIDNISANGYIDDFRITRFARYTANFTAPTSAFPLQ